MDEPRSFTVARYVQAGLLMLLLGLVMALSATQKHERVQGFALMWAGCSAVFSGFLVASPSIDYFSRRKQDRVQR